ncbi:cytochrome P450 [Suillus clintonianus]|uniref:cytochrome P450 n=1 Tax=Suillus clintonianus TaxID=1904413 RepID=UPI001B8798EE|nr:cytochrome P450 [Suillus clintonianus]KAG2133694.1 cytochrome P450 [Suillus clintonianus]
MLRLPDLHILEHRELVLAAAACLGLGAVIRAYHTTGSKLPIPPSPPSAGLLGYVLPTHKSYLTVEKWIEELGPVISFRSGTRRIVIIGRHKAAVDILEKQGGVSNDRPSMISTGDMLSGGQSIAFSHAGDRVHQMRRALHSHLGPRVVDLYEPIQLSYAKHAVVDILDDPSKFQNHTLTFMASVVMRVAYGKTERTFSGDPELKDARQRLEALGKSQRPGAYLVDSLPWLKHIPWYGKALRREFENGKKVYLAQLNQVKQQIQRNEDVNPSFAKFMLENEHSYQFTELEMAWLVGGLLLAIHSTSVALCTIFMSAALHPEEQAKVQAELDAVIGRNRVPTFEDENSLPRLRAFVLECQRWRPSAPEGMPHRTTKDVIWENYCIPAGTTVFGNHWAISRDPDVFPDPEAFKPERWLNDQGELRTDLKFYTFGFGRRVCPAQHLVPRSMFIHTLFILWAFQINLDRTKPVHDMVYMNGVVPDVQPYAVQFETRVPEQTLRRMVQDSEVA